MAFALRRIGAHALAGTHCRDLGGADRFAAVFPGSQHEAQDGRDILIAKVAHGWHHAVVLAAIDGDLASDSSQHGSDHLVGGLALEPVRTCQRRECARQALARGLVAGGALREVGSLAALCVQLGGALVDGVLAAGRGAEQHAGQSRGDRMDAHGVLLGCG
ncbi:MAG: hypothetical protein LKM32_07975 [Chiayiivirga sp.]|jgi:hypothetical protein|nr:hypothetical protein [Chiayiivirga sp.]MCI1729297.1 hypothetical protein [Chiayiivirga sp.]